MLLFQCFHQCEMLGHVGVLDGFCDVLGWPVLQGTWTTGLGERDIHKLHHLFIKSHFVTTYHKLHVPYQRPR